MPRIFDNIAQTLLPSLQQSLENAYRADFCVGYFNLRGWKHLANSFEPWSGGSQNCCRLLIGMHTSEKEELRKAFSLDQQDQMIDNSKVKFLKEQLAQEFRQQLTFGYPTNEDEASLRQLAAQIKAKKLVIKLFLHYPLHAKLYLLFSKYADLPMLGYLGSSNLTLAGLVRQGELNVDLLDHDACQKLAEWFEDRWNDKFCCDISAELAQIIDESWARAQLIPPYQIYLKMAYHLSQEAQAGLAEFNIPKDFNLFGFQEEAVKIAARHLNQRGGVLIGDVVGLGKTLMATALARIFEDDFDLETLVLCPKNLVKMWEEYVSDYRLRAKVLATSLVLRDLSELRRYRLVIIDESHNFRHRDGKRYKVIHEYIKKNESKVLLLSATPYNKGYFDLAGQLGLFITEEFDLGVRPERFIREIGEGEFKRRYQCSIRSLAAFEKSEYNDDWRDLMRFYLVRRTRKFIQQHYAQVDAAGRPFLTFADGQKFYFPIRQPRTVSFHLNDQYAQLFADAVVDSLNNLTLPRYGLAAYIDSKLEKQAKKEEQQILKNLARAGKRLKGFCRTNLFKRLESGGHVFLQSLERHILRNFVVLHALENNFAIPIGTQDASLLDSAFADEDVEINLDASEDDDQNEENPPESITKSISFAACTEEEFRKQAQTIYEKFTTVFQKRFTWLPAKYFTKQLITDLNQDSAALLQILQMAGNWNPQTDTKLEALVALLEKHSNDKVLIFTQFADTVYYLETQLKARGIKALAGVTGKSADPTTLAQRFSPQSNRRQNALFPTEEIQVLVATDVLSEGQNLQDAHIVVNYDLPWTIIRLIQRAGRVDRIGQQAPQILCYTFLPAEGVEKIIHLRERVRQRLDQNAKLLGTDEAFFEDEQENQTLDEQEKLLLNDLFTEKEGILDDKFDDDNDLASQALEIWKEAIAANPSLEQIIKKMPPVVYSAQAYQPTPQYPEGVLVYLKTAEKNDALAWLDNEGHVISESPLEILRIARCSLDTPALERAEKHHLLVETGLKLLTEQAETIGGQLGRGPRQRIYKRLKDYTDKDPLFSKGELQKVLEQIYRFPLQEKAIETLSRQLRSEISDADLVQLVLKLYNAERLCLLQKEVTKQEPQVICSLGMRKV